MKAGWRFLFRPLDAGQVASLCKEGAQCVPPDGSSRLGAANVADVMQEAGADYCIPATLNHLANR